MNAINRKKITDKKSVLIPLTTTDEGTQESQVDVREQIEREAYAAWEKDGRNHGSDQDHWYEAERKLHGQGNPAYPTLDEREEIAKSVTN